MNLAEGYHDIVYLYKEKTTKVVKDFLKSESDEAREEIELTDKEGKTKRPTKAPS